MGSSLFVVFLVVLILSICSMGWISSKLMASITATTTWIQTLLHHPGRALNILWKGFWAYWLPPLTVAGIFIPFIFDPQLLGYSATKWLFVAAMGLICIRACVAEEIHGEKEARRERGTRIAAVVIVLVILSAVSFLICGALENAKRGEDANLANIWAASLWWRHPGPSSQPKGMVHHVKSEITMTGWGSEPGNKIYAVVKVESPPPHSAPFHLLLITRVQDGTVDEMEDTQIEKSTLRPFTGQTIELIVTQQFLKRANKWKFVKVILVLLPALIQPDQISKLSDVIRVDGQIAINNSFAIQGIVIRKRETPQAPPPAPLEETIRTITLESRFTLTLKDGAELPPSTTQFWPVGGGTSQLTGSASTVDLEHKPTVEFRHEGQFIVVINTFYLAPSESLVGRPVQSLLAYDKLVVPLITVAWGESLNEMRRLETTMIVNGAKTWYRTWPLSGAYGQDKGSVTVPLDGLADSLKPVL